MNFTMSGTLLIGVSPNFTPSAANAEDVSPAMTAIKIKHFLINYEKELKECRNDAIYVAEQAKKYQRRARWATIGCGVAAGVGFVVGALLFK